MSSATLDHALLMAAVANLEKASINMHTKCTLELVIDVIAHIVYIHDLANRILTDRKIELTPYQINSRVEELQKEELVWRQRDAFQRNEKIYGL